MQNLSPDTVRDWKEEHEERIERRKEEVLERYGPIFSPDNLDELTKEEFKSFLLYDNNKHWKGIHRHGNRVTEDMESLRNALKLVLDEDEDIVTRLNAVVEKGGSHYIKGLGRAVITPILLVVYPTKYGVYNTRSEESLKNLGQLPDFKRGASFGERYQQVNQVLNELSAKYDVSLWTLDALLGHLSLDEKDVEQIDEEEDLPETIQERGIEDIQDFGMERHLEEFLVTNWENTELGNNYDLILEDGDIISQQYSTGIGYIDILARDKDDNWIVIELKKGRHSDKVLGQISRYIGWVDDELAEDGEEVEGLIIVGEEDEKLEYALKTQDKVTALTYDIQFSLSEYQE